MSLVARHLEENGIPTVVAAAARDIVETCGVPRLLFTDFPLGNPCGEPGDVAQQRQIVGMAMVLFETAAEPRTTVQTPFTWSKGDAWKSKVFTQEQPWQTEEVKNAWLAKKELYRKLKAEKEG
ncbi:MAG: hypothetical protein QF521_15060 [Alphaproteobacteria bacterium]|nr:hypothetical protein [Alphaproteobacteria bacterium]